LKFETLNLGAVYINFSKPFHGADMVGITHHRGIGVDTLQNGNSCDDANDDF
jgi:hypothetical protein